jgi:flagellar basal-body rod modification protein FlgD
MTSVDAVVGASQGTYVAGSTPTRAPKQTMDSEVFMSLLVAQLRNQDPSSPMDTNQMISQTTQLAMMEKMNELAVTGQEDFSLQMRIAAAAFVGKDVSYMEADGSTVTGVASSVSFAGPVPVVTVDGVEVPLDLISGITAPATT